MKYGSLFSGIGGFDLGFDQAGHSCEWQCEIDKRARDVLTNHWPNVLRYEDVTTLDGTGLTPVDIICGGFPCQDLSVAGKRAGLDGSRSGLWFEFKRIIAELRPKYVLIENVPGLLSSNKGQDFATLLQGLAEVGYGVAWRVLDAQYFGVAQRRRRVFIIGCLGDWRTPAEILFEPESLSGDSPPQREARTEVAGTLGGGSGSRGWAADTERMTFVASVKLAHTGSNGWGVSQDGTTGTLDSTGGWAVAAWDERNVTSNANRTRVEYGRPSNTLSGVGMSILGDPGVRRLTPTECERLQGFPDGWTEGQADSTRYRQLGNAVCVPVAKWLGERFANL